MKKQRIQLLAVLSGCMAVLLLTVALAQRIALYKLAAAAKVSAIATADLTFASDRGTDIHATVTVPQQSDTLALVVMCHGFTGNRNGDGHFQPLAEALAWNGIASIRVDFAGNGESGEPFTAYTLSSMNADIEAAIEYMQANYPIDAGRIGLLGHSMGGRAVTLHLSDAIAAAALWSPANNDGLAGLEFLDHNAEGREALRAEAAASEERRVALPGWGNVVISLAFLDEMAQSHPSQRLRAYQGALLVSFAGGDVELLSQETIDATIAAANARGKPYTNLCGQFGGANHNYDGALDGDAGAAAAIAERIETQTAQFFIGALAA